MRTFDFPFDDLPLAILSGYECALISGSAEISFHPDGSWSIVSISLDGWRDGPKPVPVALDAGTPIYLMIYDRLEHEWREGVQSAVYEAIAADREARADDYADYRRDQMREAV